MSCSEAGNAVGGIRVRRDTQVTVEDCRDSVERRRHPPFTTTIRSAGLGEHTTPWQQQRSSRANASPAASGSSHPVREGLRSDALDRTMAKKREEEHTTQDLVDFLRKTSPPPGNPMSRLTLVDKRHEKKSKRFPFWPFRKRKETITTSERTSGLIKLPDSAVAGTTIGGHRYIAISIPIEHAHMSPVPRPTASSPAGRLGNDTLVGELAGDGPGARESQDWDETNYTTPARDDMRLLPCQLSNGDARQKTARPPRARFGSVSVGAHNMTPKHYMPELTAQPKGMAGVPVDVMDGMPGQSRSLCHRPVLHPVSAHEARLQDGEAIQSTDTTLLNKLESVAESSHATSSSELVCSDAETVNITSSQSTAEISPSSDESGSFHTAGPAQSPLVSPHLDSTERGDPSMQSPAASNFSALCDPSTSQTSSPSELAFPQRILFSHGFHQPHALSAITSVDSLSLSTPQDARSPSMAPFVPLAEHQPSRTSLRQISGTLTPLSPPIEGTLADHSSKPPRQTHSIPEMRGALAPPRKHSLLPGFHPTKAWWTTTTPPPPQTLTPTLPPTINPPTPSSSSSPSSSTSSFTTFTTNPYPNPPPAFHHHPLRPPHHTRPPTTITTTPPPSSSPPPHHPPPPSSSPPPPSSSPPPPPLPPRRTDSHRALLCRYEALSQTRALELEGMLDRLERLESAHKRWMAALEPVLEGGSAMAGRSTFGRGMTMGRRGGLNLGDGYSDNDDIDSGASSSGGSLQLRLRLRERELRKNGRGRGRRSQGRGGGGGGEGSFDFGVYSGGGGDYLDGVGVGGEGSAGRRDERRIIAHTGRFEFDSVDAARDMRSTADGRDGAVGDDDGQVDANDQSWLPRESGSATWLVSGSGELVLKSHGRALRRLEMRDGLDGSVWGSTKNLRVGQGSWRRATSAGRQAEAFARDQRRWRRRAALSGRDGGQRTCRIEDPSGYNGLETVMRDLVLASRDADESAKVSSA